MGYQNWKIGYKMWDGDMVVTDVVTSDVVPTNTFEWEALEYLVEDIKGVRELFYIPIINPGK